MGVFQILSKRIETIFLLDAWKDPLAMTNRVNSNPFLN